MLYASQADARATTFQRVLAAGEAYCRDTRALLLRASLVQHDFVQVGVGWLGVGFVAGVLLLRASLVQHNCRADGRGLSLGCGLSCASWPCDAGQPDAPLITYVKGSRDTGST